MNQYEYYENPIWAERKSLRHDANYIGIISVVLTGLLQVVFVAILFILTALNIADLREVQHYYGLSETGFLIAYAAAYTIGMGLPAPLISLIARRHVHPFSRYEQPGEEERQLRPFSVFLALMAGMAICILANIVTSYILTIFKQFGIEAPEMPSYINTTGLSLFINVVIFALLPAIFEEMVYRGYILRTLRHYGNGFAIVVSSLLFALMHGNILQIPFAFIVGLACGYLVIYTGRIWPAMMLHFLNNFMSTLLQYVQQFTVSDQQNQVMTLIVFGIIIVLGLTALLILYATKDPVVRQLNPEYHGTMRGRQKTGALLASPVFIISLVISLILTVVSTIGGSV